jgi:hypothetical protein
MRVVSELYSRGCKLINPGSKLINPGCRHLLFNHLFIQFFIQSIISVSISIIINTKLPANELQITINYIAPINT